ncbi:MAG: hypothetical protein AB7I27_19135 [Bacteriovoracaceae bacterium]
MSNLSLLVKNMNKSQEKIKDLFENTGRCYVIHYSCESFYDRTSTDSPRITSIAVKNVESEQVTSFSIHLIAERNRTPVDLITQNYDALETQMLQDFFYFVGAHTHVYWIHWKMRDNNYGFKAIEHRFSVLGGSPVIIPDNNKFDLSSLIHDIYGDNYAGHPRLPSLVKLNEITDMDFLTGAEEARAFDQGRYFDLHRSTLRKVDILQTIGTKAASGTLKTNSWAFRSVTMNILVIVERIQKHWLTTLILFVAAILGLFTDVGNFLN